MMQPIHGKTMNIPFDYWKQYYENAVSNNLNHLIPSQFAAFCAVEAKEIGVKQLIDIAAGDGRDSVFFANLGFEVMSLEASSSAIEIIKSRSKGLKNLKPIQIDVTNKALPKPTVSHEVCSYYARFFIHTLPEPQLKKFFENLSNAMHYSQYFFTEYRNEKDTFLTKHTPDHDRYFHKSELIKTIAEVHKLKCVYETEGKGFAKWKTDDAFVTRQIYIKSEG